MAEQADVSVFGLGRSCWVRSDEELTGFDSIDLSRLAPLDQAVRDLQLFNATLTGDTAYIANHTDPAYVGP